MSFIAKNPLSMPKIETNPSTPSGTRGLFAKDDGWYDIDDNGDIVKICSNNDIDNHMLKLLEETKLYIDEEIAKFDFIKIMSELPETGEENYIYLIPNNSDESKNIYDEYIWTGNDWEHFGAKQVDVNLDSYAKKSDLSNYVTKEDGKGLSTNDFTDDDKDSIHTHTNKEVLDGITAEKVNKWDNKSDFSGSYNDLKDKPKIPSIKGLATEKYVDEINCNVKELQYYGKTVENITPAYTAENATGECLIYKVDTKTNTATITGYNGNLTDIVIPYEVDGHLVTKIGNGAFSYYSYYNPGSINSCVIPDSVTTIGAYAFSCQTDLQFNIPKYLKTIGAYAFEDIHSSSINILELPDTVVSVEAQAFLNASIYQIKFSKGMSKLVSETLYDNYDLKSVVLPSSITTIPDDWAVWWDNGIYNPQDTVFYVEEGSVAEEWCKKFNTTYKYTEIGSGVLALKSEVNAEIAETNNGLDRITYYGDHTIKPSLDCFYYDEEYYPDMASLKWDSTTLNEISTLVIPYALNGKILTKVDVGIYTLPNNIKSIIIPNCVTTMYYGAIQGSGIESIEIPESVTYLSSEAIIYATSLKKIIIHNDNIYIEKVVYDDGTEYFFSSCHEDLTIYCNPGSTAEAFCIENGLNYSYINYMSERAVKDGKGNIIHDTYAEKIQISKVSPSEGVITYVFSDLHNTEMRVNDSPVFIDFDIGVDVYPEDYTSSLVFDSGDTPPTLGYTKSPILNWIGTDCSITDRLSIFAPQANTHYDVLFYFNGTCFVGLVNGYKFATSNTAVE